MVLSIEVPSAVTTCMRDLSSSLHVTRCDTWVTHMRQTSLASLSRVFVQYPRGYWSKWSLLVPFGYHLLPLLDNDLLYVSCHAICLYSSLSIIYYYDDPHMFLHKNDLPKWVCLEVTSFLQICGHLEFEPPDHNNPEQEVNLVQMHVNDSNIIAADPTGSLLWCLSDMLGHLQFCTVTNVTFH